MASENSPPRIMKIRLIQRVVVCAVVSLLTFLNAANGASGENSFSHFIVIDQFGYTPAMKKVAVIRDPVLGFDAGRHFNPGAIYQVVAADTGTVVFEGAPVAWRQGQVDESSGDRVWHFDFSAVTEPGNYVVRDKDKGETSGRFTISPNPYRQVLVQAVRFFYYQRANFAKAEPYAASGWTTKADHLGPGQDAEARDILRRDDPSTARDLHGGWWDAGDMNCYTNWHTTYLISLLHSYSENPSIFTDDFNIPESGNGIPDLIDEVKYGMDWLIRMQNPDGSMLSILAPDPSSPPSATSKPSYYGGPSTSSTYMSAAAFAYGAKVFARFPAFKGYAAELASRAKRAWAWAEANPDVVFFNRDPGHSAPAMGGGEQEVPAEQRPLCAMLAALYLYDLTGDTAYQDRFKSLVGSSPLFKTGNVQMYEAQWLQPMLYYSSLKSADPVLAGEIREQFAEGFKRGVYGPEHELENPYLAYLPVYYWGSTRAVSDQGSLFLDAELDGIPGIPADVGTYAADYLHYLHGVNPLAKVYLSNMGAFGAENSVDEFYHSWFAKNSPWANVRTSQFGPPPGYLAGGPNPSYNWAKGCPQLTPACGAAPPSPPFGQPPQKSYADFGDSWPINSWEVTEPDCGYQVAYIALLTHFVTAATRKLGN